MEAKFWLDKWQANEIAFHEERPHPMLLKHWGELDIERKSRVFVPLCGKSRDMVWLRERGHEVVGVELSEIAAEAFFAQSNLQADRTERGASSRYSGGGYSILCGDLFNLAAADLGSFAAIYDRAALIALPPETRIRYAQHLRSLSASGTEILLITLAYPSDALNPPPFIVADDDVTQYYSLWCDVQKLATGAAKVKGIDGSETVYRLQVNA